jgi:tRNA dimethylallyltransferase
MPHPLVTILAGPTASGKSAKALELADSRPSLVINADSAQVYDHLPILTNQPSAAELAAVPHALVGFLPSTAPYSVGQWLQDAQTAIDQAVANGQHPIVVGGTGLYLKALTKGLAVMPAIPPIIREQALALMEMGEEVLRGALAVRDPLSASRIRPRDFVRLLRAYEVVMASGRAIWDWQQTPVPPPPYRFHTTLLLPDRALLYQRINQRFAAMVDAGAVEEVAAVLARYNDPTTIPASLHKVLGFAQLQAYVQGALSLEAAIDQAAQATRHYAKRQYTWFRHQGLDARDA